MNDACTSGIHQLLIQLFSIQFVSFFVFYHEIVRKLWTMFGTRYAIRPSNASQLGHVYQHFCVCVDVVTATLFF